MITQNLKLGLLRLILGVSLTAPTMTLSKFEHHYQPVEIGAVTDNGETFSVYPVTQHHLNKQYRAYSEAMKSEDYTLRIRNHSNQRLRLVIAIDGLNIVSGKQSHLKYHENMYISDPYQTQTDLLWLTYEKQRYSPFLFHRSRSIIRTNIR